MSSTRGIEKSLVNRQVNVNVWRQAWIPERLKIGTTSYTQAWMFEDTNAWMSEERQEYPNVWKQAQIPETFKTLIPEFLKTRIPEFLKKRIPEFFKTQIPECLNTFMNTWMFEDTNTLTFEIRCILRIIFLAWLNMCPKLSLLLIFFVAARIFRINLLVSSLFSNFLINILNKVSRNNESINFRAFDWFYLFIHACIF